MPTIYDNIETPLLGALLARLGEATRADFCVGYFNLRGWRKLAPRVDLLTGGEGSACRLMIGMHKSPEQETREALRESGTNGLTDNATLLRLKKQMALEFRDQLMHGSPTNADEATLRQLRRQLLEKKVQVKLYLRTSLHAKLYLVHRADTVAPIVGYVGSSNLTQAGLSQQGELNVDVIELDATTKLQRWFDERWNDRQCIDISKELADIIEESWAGERLLSPYLIYLKIAYHLSEEARAGLTEFKIPRDFTDRLFDFQTAAVKIAARHLNTRGGVLLGDVVGLGKTMMATALARVFQDDHGTETLIICPKNLESMWQDYVDEYRLIARVLPISRAINELPDLRRFRLVIIDESHNLRNPEGKIYRAIREYVQENDSRCILLSATPYNKSYQDLSTQLGIFIADDAPIGIRPDHYIREIGEAEFSRRHQAGPRTLKAFEHSPHPEDWRALMARYLVRRTRSFIKANYALTDDEGRPYLDMADGERSYFPARVPRTVRFQVDESDPGDQYATLFGDGVVEAINQLRLPRYGLGNYALDQADPPPTAEEREALERLARAGKRLVGFSRTNLFKRLESSGAVFLQSVERHIVRNFVYLHAIDNGLPIPIGSQDPRALDTRMTDLDAEAIVGSTSESAIEGEVIDDLMTRTFVKSEEEYRREAARTYQGYQQHHGKRFAWLRPTLFDDSLREELLHDTRALMSILNHAGLWEPTRDTKLNALEMLLREQHPREKVLIFSQFADTVEYLHDELQARGITHIDRATGQAADPTALAWRFSPASNDKTAYAAHHGELRALIATDVLSEGQNLQDAAIIVNFDLPWAIIRLIQRAGRVDRIGQRAHEIVCYSFLPADGIERIIRLRSRVRARLRENEEVVGADEVFFEDDERSQPLLNLYNEQTTVLEDEDDGEVDLASYAYQIWKNALDNEPKAAKQVMGMPDVVYATRDLRSPDGPGGPGGVLVYVRLPDGTDGLGRVDVEGQLVTESPVAILNAAACDPWTPGMPRDERHHTLVRTGMDQIVQEERRAGGQLGRPSGARFRTYTRLQAYERQLRGTQGTLPIFAPNLDALSRVIESIYRYPLRQAATDSFNRMLRSGADDEALARRAIELHDEDRLVIRDDAPDDTEPKIICSMGLFERVPRE
jgi:superfamily II DNA or RNA helicase